MAIDPSISLGVRPPVIQPLQIQNPLEQYGKVLTLRNLMQQGQLGDLSLQEQQIKLAEAQRATKERADFAAYLAQRVRGGAPGTAAAAAPAQATPTQTVPAPDTTDFDLSGTPAVTPGAPLRTLVAPAPSAPAIPAPDTLGPHTFDYGEILTRFPTIGPGFAKNALEYQKAQAEAQVKQHEVNAGMMDELGRIGVSIRDSKDPEAQFKIGVTNAASKGLIPSPMAAQMLADGYAKHANDIQAFIDQAQNAKDSSDIARTSLLADQEAQKKAAKLMLTINNQDDYETKFLPNVPRSVRAQLGTTFSPQLKSVVQMWDVPGAQLPKAALEQIQTDSVKLAAAMKQGPEATQAVFATLGPESQRIFKDAPNWQEVVKRGLTPEQVTTADQAAAGTELTELEIDGKPHKVLVRKGTGEVVKDLGLSGFKPQQVNVNANASLLDRESARFAKPHEKAVTDANTQLEKINEARSLINGPATAQALGIPKVLSSLVGGAGSGLRMTKAELDSIAKARGITGDVEGFINKVSGAGTLTSEQQRQLTGLLDDVAARIQQKQTIANDALDRINSAGSREEIVRIDSEVRRKLAGSQNTGSGPAATSQYKAGDTRVINGKTYTRDANGNWK